MSEFSKKQIIDIVTNGIAIISFIKKSTGELREMKCTKNMTLIPKDKIPNGSGRAVNENQVRVFDLEKNDWRSFDINTVQSIVI